VASERLLLVLSKSGMWAGVCLGLQELEWPSPYGYGECKTDRTEADIIKHDPIQSKVSHQV